MLLLCGCVAFAGGHPATSAGMLGVFVGVDSLAIGSGNRCSFSLYGDGFLGAIVGLDSYPWESVSLGVRCLVA